MKSKNDRSILDNMSIASPCSASWDEMNGDDRARFCGQCSKHVYNISTMTKTEVETLVLAKEGKLCVRYFQRPDGTILTDDCPRGLRAVRDGFRKISAGLAACVSLMIAAMPARAGDADSTADKKSGSSTVEPTRPLMGAPVPRPRVKMGEFMIPPQESKTEPWMDAYKKAHELLVLKNVSPELKFNAIGIFVTLDRTGKVMSYQVDSANCDTADGVLFDKLGKTVKNTQFQALPTSYKPDYVVLKLQLSKK